MAIDPAGNSIYRVVSPESRDRCQFPFQSALPGCSIPTVVEKGGFRMVVHRDGDNRENRLFLFSR